MNSARHEGILAKSESYLHLIAVAPSDKSVEEMVSLLKAEPGEDYDKKPTWPRPVSRRRGRLLSTYQSQILQETVDHFERVQQRTVGHVPVSVPEASGMHCCSRQQKRSGYKFWAPHEGADPRTEHASRQS